MKKGILFGCIVMTGLAAVGMYYLGLLGGKENIRKAGDVPAVQAFREVDSPFTHMAHSDRFPFTGGTVLDIDDNGTMEIFISGSKGQSNGVFTYLDGTWADITGQTGLAGDDAFFGVTSFDMDNDGDTDLVAARHDGVWIYTNTGGKFDGWKIAMTLPEHSFPVNVAITDLDRNGMPDLYVSNFVTPAHFAASTFNKPEHAKPNTMLLNLGNGRYEDITERTGTGGTQNTFHSAFIDLDGNGHQDLILANNTGPVEIFKNMGRLHFEKHEVNSGFGYWMGLGCGDIDKDGDQDLYLSNIGSSIAGSLVRGDLREDQPMALEWLLLRNDGNWKFSNATTEYALDGYGFAWGGVFEDINLDGDLDLLVAQNYIKWPGHTIRKLQNKAFLQFEQNGKKGFYHLDHLGLNNPYYGQSPLIVDINNDAKPDVVWLNMNGPARVLINNSGNNSVKIIVQDNLEYLGAQIVLETENGRSYTRQITAAIGMATDQTPNVFFGLGQEDTVKAVHITKSNGVKQVLINPGHEPTITLR
ncbi:MAG: VCBS repeat-containing protein [Desulfobacter sp.]